MKFQRLEAGGSCDKKSVIIAIVHAFRQINIPGGAGAPHPHLRDCPESDEKEPQAANTE